MKTDNSSTILFATVLLCLQMMCSAQMVSSAVSSAASDIQSSISYKHIPTTTCR